MVVHLVGARDTIEATIDDDLVERAEGESGLDLVVVCLDRVPLVVGHPPDVTEATAAGELSRRHLFEDLPLDRRGRRVRAPELRAADGEYVRAGLREARCEDGSDVGGRRSTDAALLGPDAGVTRRQNDRDALQAQLHVLVALAVLVVVGEQILDGAVRDGNDVGWLVDAALKVALVPYRCRKLAVGIYRICAYFVGAITSLVKGAVGAVAAVDGVKEGFINDLVSTSGTRGTRVLAYCSSSLRFLQSRRARRRFGTRLASAAKSTAWQTGSPAWTLLQRRRQSCRQQQPRHLRKIQRHRQSICSQGRYPSESFGS